jgi:hypothetical protein
VKIPLLKPIVPTVVLLLLQVPPVVASFNVVVVPAQIEVIPVIVAGDGFTVIVALTEQLPTA